MVHPLLLKGTRMNQLENKQLIKIILACFLFILTQYSAIQGQADTFSLQVEHDSDTYLFDVDKNYIQILKNDDSIMKYTMKEAKKTKVGQQKKLTDFQKESISLIKTLSLQFLLFAAGIFSLTVIYLLQNPRRFSWIGIPFIILASYLFFGASMYFGYRVWGNIIWQLKGNAFDSFHGILVYDAKYQFYSFFIGSGILLGSILLNTILAVARPTPGNGKGEAEGAEQPQEPAKTQGAHESQPHEE